MRYEYLLIDNDNTIMDFGGSNTMFREICFKANPNYASSAKKLQNRAERQLENFLKVYR